MVVPKIVCIKSVNQNQTIICVKGCQEIRTYWICALMPRGGMNWTNTMFIPSLKLRSYPVHPICVEWSVMGIFALRLWWKIEDLSDTNPKRTSMNVIWDVDWEGLHSETQKSSSTFKLQPVFFVRPRAECVHDYITQKYRNKETLMNVNHKVQDFPSIILGKMGYLSNLSRKMESESDSFQRFSTGTAL